MRLSRPRLALRAALLSTGGAFMAWKAVAAHRGARAEGGPGALLLERLALVWALVAALAIGAAIVALLALRPRPRRHTLHLRDRPRDEGQEP